MKKPVQIIKVTNNHIGEELVQTVNSRELWKELGVQKDYSDWIKAQIETLDFEENLDYLKLPQKGESKNTLGRGGDRRSIDYILSLDAAKHIALASRTPKGKEVRKYFIELEKYARHILQEKAEASNILEYVNNEQEFIKQKQDSTINSIGFIRITGENLRNLLHIELNSLIVLNKAYIDSIEEPLIQKMFISLIKSIEVKRDYILEEISSRLDNYDNEFFRLCRNLGELEEKLQVAKEKIEASD